MSKPTPKPGQGTVTPQDRKSGKGGNFEKRIAAAADKQAGKPKEKGK